MEETISEFHDLESVYGRDAWDATQRYDALRTSFERTFGESPELYARAPGRVNLIGEHIDYEGYAVLPMAIKLDTIVAIKRGGTKLAIANLDSEQYPQNDFDVDPDQEVNAGKHVWANYFLCAYKGIFEHLAMQGRDAPQPVGLMVMLHGTVPLGSGLSSSAAMVCACALAIAGALGVVFSQSEVAAFTAKAEQHVGVTSGGMDQAISIMARPGAAQLIHFNPVRATDVNIPSGATFVVGHSLAVSLKAETASTRYNLRVLECRLAAAVMIKALGESSSVALKTKTLKEVEPYIVNRYGPGDEAKLKAVEECLHSGGYSVDEVEAELGIPLEKLCESQKAALKVIVDIRESGSQLQLKNRALHVFGEANRVLQFQRVCESDSPPDAQIRQLGALMDDSHSSCSTLYDCSVADLDELVACARQAGAVGARLTGAGWGGCTVSLVRDADVPRFLATVRERFYATRLEAKGLAPDALASLLFPSKPSSGAAILRLRAHTRGDNNSRAADPALAAV